MRQNHTCVNVAKCGRVRNGWKATLTAGLIAAAAGMMCSSAMGQEVLDRGGVVIMPQIRRSWHLREARAEITKINASIDIRDQVAMTTIEMTITNSGASPVEVQLMLPVPDGVLVRSLVYDGVGPEPKAEVLPRDEARRVYDSIVSKMKDPALVEFAGYNLIRTSVFPIPANGSQKLSLTYEQVLMADGKRVDYVLPRGEAFSGAGIDWAITADIRSGKPISTVFSSSHDLTTERIGQERMKVTMREAGGGRGSVRLSYLSAGTDAGLNTSTILFPDPEIGGGYFLLLGGLPATLPDEGEMRKREVTIVIDRSGSMRNQKIEQTIRAATEVVRGLKNGESFNIIDYSDSIASFAGEPVIKTEQTGRDAEKYIAAIRADGGTNLHDALIESLRTEPSEGRVPLVLFMTDGLPTVGERSEVKIRESVMAANKFGRRIFSFGVGFDVNTPLLVNVAQTSRGASTFVLPDEDVEAKVSQVFRRLSGPVMGSPKLLAMTKDGEASSRLVRDAQPAVLPDLFAGDQLVVLGQYVGDAPMTVRVEGDYLGKSLSFDCVIDPKRASMQNSYVARLWANRKITALVDEIRQAGADGTGSGRMKELTDEIVRLSIKYGILTEYTAFLAREDAPVTGGRDALGQVAGERLRRRAMETRSGAGGVAQQADIELKAVPSAAADNRGYWYGVSNGKVEKQQVDTVQNIAGEAYFLRNNRWVQAAVLEKEKEAPEEVVEFGSKRYDELVDEFVKEGRQAVLAQSNEVYLLVKGKRVLVKRP